MQRFELKLDANKMWTVVDNSTGLPAKAGGRELVGLDLEAAQQAMFSANVDLLRAVAERRFRSWERKR
jgi:hypothetical protein